MQVNGKENGGGNTDVFREREWCKGWIGHSYERRQADWRSKERWGMPLICLSDASSLISICIMIYKDRTRKLTMVGYKNVEGGYTHEFLDTHSLRP